MKLSFYKEMIQGAVHWTLNSVQWWAFLGIVVTAGLNQTGAAPAHSQQHAHLRPVAVTLILGP